jgi:membrane protein
MDSIRQAIRSFRELQENYILTAVIFTFLLFVATTLFKIIKGSINEIWNIRGGPRQSLILMLRSRGISVAVILLGGILFFAIQLIDSGRQLVGRYLPHSGFHLGNMLSIVIVVLVSTLWFYVLFVYLPDGRPARRIAIGGAAITAVLFYVGKLILRSLLSPGRLNSFYGASGAILLVLLFMFYSSLILYFGAALIKAWSDAVRQPVSPNTLAGRRPAGLEA